MNLPELKTKVGLEAVDSGTGRTVTILDYSLPKAGESAINVTVQAKGDRPYVVSSTWLR